MSHPRINAIAAVGRNREIGKGGALIWKFDTDYQWMRSIIDGHPLIMGRRTYESIGRELEYSQSVVITSRNAYRSPYPNASRTHLAHSLEDAIDTAAMLAPAGEVFIFGGAQVYEEALPRTDQLYIAEIDATDKEADSRFPPYCEFTEVVEEIPATERGVSLVMRTLTRAEGVGSAIT